MAKPTGLEELRTLFADNRQHIAVGKITQIALNSDRSALRVQVLVFDASAESDREVVAIMGWDDCGPNSGSIRFPEVDDLVLVAFADGHPDQAFVIKRLTSKEEKLPLKAKDGHSIHYALAGKKIYIGSDSKVCIGKPDSEPSEPLVLGNLFKTWANSVLDALISHKHISGAPGAPTTPADNVADFTSAKGDIADLVSDTVFTEK